MSQVRGKTAQGPTGIPVELLLDASGRVIISGDPAAVSLTVNPPFGNYWDAIKAAYGAQAQNLSLPAGSSVINMPAVPANNFRHISISSCLYAGTTTGVKLAVYAIIGGVGILVGSVLTVVSWQSYIFLLDLMLGPGDYMQLSIQGATLNDDAYIWAAGKDFSTA